MVLSDEMVAAARAAYSKATGAEDTPHHLDGWIEDALRAAIKAALDFETKCSSHDLGPKEIEFLQRLHRGQHPGVADRDADKFRQRVRKLGLARVATNPRRWVITADGVVAISSLSAK